MKTDIERRIDAMFARDTAAAAVFVVALWLVMAFVFVEMIAVAGAAVTATLFAGGVLVTLFNTVSITAMIHHFRREKDRIYRLDIEHLDATRAERR